MELEARVFKTLQYPSVAQSPDRRTKTLSSPRIRSKTYRHIEKTVIRKQRRKVDAKAEFIVKARSEWTTDRLEVQKDKLAGLAHEKNQRFEALFDATSVAPKVQHLEIRYLMLYHVT
ncbi:hypothetical protein ACOSQ4_006403 [Xanthoceras sorbifolium]